MESLAARRASKHGYKKKKLQLSPEVTNSETCPTPPPVRSLKASLAAYEGMELREMQDFIFDKKRFLNASDINIKAFERQQTLSEGEGRTVYKVRHVHTDLILVQKVIHYDNSAETHRVLSRELNLLHECHAPEIVNFFGSFIDDSEIHIILEYMNGGCLHNVLRRVGRIEEITLVHICEKVLKGLEYLERNKVIHRDIKPANILVNTSGRVKLCDFGVSKKLNASCANTFIGTMRYMSPERILGEHYNAKSDIWSLGLSLVEMATGVYPFLPGVDPTNPQIVKSRKPSEFSVNPGEKHRDMAVFDIISAVVNGPIPSLRKTDTKRPTLEELRSSEWITRLGSFRYDLAEWVRSTLPFAQTEDADTFEDMV
eukprot:gene2563-5482_t